MERGSCPVDVISFSSADGCLRPLRLRIPQEDQSLLRVDIDEIVETSLVERVCMEAAIFLCRATIGQKCCIFKLKYTMRSHTWYLIRAIY